MAKFFDSFELVIRLSDIIGINNTYDLVLNNIYRTGKTLCSTDMIGLYDQEYTQQIIDYPAVKRVGPFDINYYNTFIFNYLDARKDRNASILDIGCGSGELSLALAFVGYSVHGVDISEHAIRNALKEKGKHIFAKALQFEIRDAQSISGKYNYIVLSDVIEHLSLHELEKLLQKCSALLTDDGELLIHTPNGRATRFSHEYRILYLFASKIKRIVKKTERSLADLKSAYYMQMHINVMGPKQLRKVLERNGLGKIKLYFRSPHNRKHLPFLDSIVCNDMGVICKLTSDP
jgi:2-polyprenyl-3-methyl-5-hydroxy-6-metoxy-1,4-benzoquinol methylase